MGFKRQKRNFNSNLAYEKYSKINSANTFYVCTANIRRKEYQAIQGF